MMSSEGEDDDLARAIALSLQEHNRPRQPEVITIDDDEDDEDARYQADLERALEASKVHAQPNQVSSPSRKFVAEAEKQRPGPSSFLSERAKLERERLARQKRLRKEAGLQNTENAQEGDEKSESGSDIGMAEPPAKRQHISTSSSNRSAASGSSTSAGNAELEVFWDGELRQTATRFAEPRKDGRPTFRLTQVLGKKSDLTFAILSSYSLDMPWIYEMFDPSVPVIMVAQPDATGQAAIKYTFPTWIKTTPALRGGFGCQHMKFMLLFYKTNRLRVVISTANLIAYDWRDMENSVWVQDVPLRSNPIPHDSKAIDDFPSIMQRVLYAVNVLPALKTLLREHSTIPIKTIEDLRALWDWSKVKVHLVPSIAGKHEGWPNVIKTGHPRLMMAVRKMGLRTGKGLRKTNLVIECQGSSLGNYSTQWVNEFHWSARGESAEDWLPEPKKRREKLPFPLVKFVFPTKKTVQESTLGEPGGGTIFCRRKQWGARNFPRDKFHNSKSKGGNVLMHSKMIIATMQPIASANPRKEASDTEDEESDDEIEIMETAVGWAYVGSHNFTPSAWGTLSGSAFNPILNITNYEIGIVFPLRDEAEANNVACFERPPRKYTAGIDEPWIQEESIYHQPEAGGD